ncbi:hypothetical protein BH23CHL5_BH23CHL5_28270 [soil metagenome]
MKRAIYGLIIASAFVFSPLAVGAQQATLTPRPIPIGGGVVVVWYEYFPDPDFPRLIGEIENVLEIDISTCEQPRW